MTLISGMKTESLTCKIKVHLKYLTMPFQQNNVSAVARLKINESKYFRIGFGNGL